MLDDLDRTLKVLLELYLPQPGTSSSHGSWTYNISFKAPDREHITTPGINLFLYDVRENLDLRNTVSGFERQTSGAAMQATRRRSPARVDCSYLITAWVAPIDNPDPLVEHMMLGQVMEILLRFSILPTEVLQGRLRGQEPSAQAFALRPGHLQSPGDFWQAMGGKPKATLNYTVTITVPRNEVIETAPLVTSQYGMGEPPDPTAVGLER